MSLYDWRPFLNGGLASMTAEFFTFPIDLVKTRLQLQGQVIDVENSKLKYRGMIHGLITITKEEGVVALYNGLKPALLRQATYGTLKIGFYQTLKKSFHKDGKEVLWFNVCCGAVSGAVAVGIANPTDVLKVRLQAKHEKLKSTSMTNAFLSMAKGEGVRGLYRGIVPNMQRAAIITAVELPVYDSVKSFLVMKFQMDSKNFSTHFAASSVAGMMATLAATPIDVIKTRLMNQKRLKSNDAAPAPVPGAAKVHQQQIYKSSIDCLIHTIRNEGVFALYKGIIPAYLRLGPWNILFFVSYEQLKKVTG